MLRFGRLLLFVAVALLGLQALTLLWPRSAASGANAVISAFQPTATPRAGKPALTGAARPKPTVARLAATSVPPTPAPTVAQTPTPDPAAEQSLVQSLDQYLNGLVQARLFHGAVLIARHGRILIDKGYGSADVGSGTPNTSRTRFRLASVSKQFTAMAIMQLQAQGRLKVQDPICNYLDNCPDAWKPIAIRNLLTHTSGLPSYTDFLDYGATQMHATTPDDLVARFRDQPLLFAPGSAYSYGNSGYLLLALIVEKASGQPFAAFLRNNIFAPLKMEDSGVSEGATAAGEALGYQQFDTPAPPLDASTLFGSGDLYSTVEDMYRWDQALTAGLLLPPALQTEMFTPGLSGYGYGWKINNPDGRLRISHPGLIDGFASAIVRYPNDGVTVIVLSNMSGADAPGIADYLAGLALTT